MRSLETDWDWCKLTELHESISIGSNDARILQTDKGDKHTDTCRYGKAEVSRDALQYLVTDIEEGDGKEDDALYEQYCQSLLPGQPLPLMLRVLRALPRAVSRV